MSFHDLPSRCIAFSAMCQAASLVDQIARTGICSDVIAFEASLMSTLKIDSDSPLQIYGAYESLAVGIKSAIEQLENTEGKRNMQVTKYIIGMISLENKLTANSSLVNILSERINQVQRQLSHVNISDISVLKNFDSIYKDIISDLGPKIQVNGTPACLQQEISQHKIRALLLSGVRAAVLWRQLGGKRRQLIFSRKAILNQLKQDLVRV
ncbi:MAG: high frequency lysogenization protein HflD [Psychromonas sp.]|nr:high frequency lysogenization protein HflD [Psychromonas sp.]